MSEKNDGEGQKDQGEGQKSVDVKDLQARLEQLEATNARLLNESKQYKEKFKSASGQLEELEKSKLEKDGNLQQLLEAEREKIKKFEDENKVLKQKTLKTNIINKLTKFAAEANDIDDLLNQPKFSDLLKNGIDDEALELSDDAAKKYVTAVFEAKPWLKKNAAQTGAITKRPGYVEAPTGTKGLTEMSSAEIEKVLKEKFGN